MPSTPPYREPCGHYKVWRGCCFQHGVDPILVHKFSNTTTVDGSPPAEQWAADPGSSCGTYFMPTGTAWSKPYPTNVFTDTGDFVDMAVPHKHGFKNVFARRCWQGALPWTAPESGCATNLCPGVTGYQAYQSTPSSVKYLKLTIAATLSSDWDDQDGATLNHFTASASGYRLIDEPSGKITSTLSTAQTVTEEPDSGGGAVTTDQDITNGAGTISGVYSPAGLTTVMDNVVGYDYHCGTPVMPTTGFFGGFNFLDQINTWNGALAGGSDPFPAPTDPNSYDETVNAGNGVVTIGTFRISWSRTATVFSWAVAYIRTDGITQNYSFSGSATLSSPNTQGDLKADLVSLLAWWPLNDDSLYPWRTDLKTGVAPLVSRNEVQTNVSPVGFNTYTVDDLANPATDVNGVAPFGGGWIPTYAQIAWFDSASYLWTFAPGTDATNAAATGLLLLYDGSILGKPNPAGYQDNFDFNFVDMRGCCDRPGDGSQTWSWNIIGSGQNVSTFNLNTGCHLPLNATQWNNWFSAINKPPCAFMFYSDQSDYYGSGCVSSSGISKAGDAGQFVMGKWAEIGDLWNSQNFAMPAGDAKYWFNEDHVYCAVNVSGTGDGSTWTLTDPRTTLAPPDADIDTGKIWGGPVVGGFFNITSYSAGTITLGSQVYDVPSNWVSKSHVTVSGVNDEDSCFGMLRWPTYPALLGRAAITTTGPGTTFTFTVAQPAFGMDASTHQEQVDLYDASMTLLASNVTATRVDDSTFTVASGQPTATFVQIHGSAKWYVNDTAPKGDFTKLDWTADLRTPGEYGRLSGQVDCDGVALALPTANAGGGPPTLPFAEFNQVQCCLPFIPCAPKVMCISPNGETFPNGVTYDFPSTFNLDEQYGSKWWGKIEQSMTDLFWQTPHRPCSIEDCASWGMDSSCADDVAGTCPAGDSPAPQYFFAHAPQVEARLTVPSIADDCSKGYGADGTEAGPALPASIQIGWLSPVLYDTGDVAFPPVSPGVSGSDGTPGGVGIWAIHELFCGVGCRFSYSVPGC